MAIVILVELNLGVELKVCVDLVLGTWAVGVPVELVDDVETETALVAVPVLALSSWVVTLVSSGGPRPLVGLHEVELWAPVAINLVGIAVAVSVGVHPEVAVLVLAGHPDEVPGSDAAALVVAQIDVPLDGAAEEVGHEVLRVRLVEVGSLANVATAVGWDGKVRALAALGEGSRDVVGLLLTVNLDLDLIKRVHVLLLQVHQVLVLLVIVRLSGSDKNCGDSQLHLDCVCVS